MEDEHIVSSAASRIALGNLWDEDIDAVVTLQLSTFMPNAEEGLGLNKNSSLSNNIPRLEPNTLGTSIAGQAPRTFDEMKPLLWVITAIAAAFCAMIVLRLYNIRKRRMLLSQKQRRYAR